MLGKLNLRQNIQNNECGVEITHWQRFFVWTDSEENQETLLKELSGFHDNINLTHYTASEKINFLDLVVKIKNVKLTTHLSQ